MLLMLTMILTLTLTFDDAITDAMFSDTYFLTPTPNVADADADADGTKSFLTPPF